jgi:hypothetical protein
MLAFVTPRGFNEISPMPNTASRQTPMNNRPFILRPTLRAMSARSLLAWRHNVQASLPLTGGEASRPAPLDRAGPAVAQPLPAGEKH